MSGTTPPQGPDEPVRPASFDHQPPGGDDVVTIGAPQEPPGRSSRTPKIVAGAAALALVVGGGAYAMVQADPFNLFNSGPQAAQALPADAIAYVGIDLDPAATQKIDALRFLNHFPAFKDEFDLGDRDDVRESLLEDVLAECDGLTYSDDVEPWLGHKVGVAVLPEVVDNDEDAVVVAVETSDTDAAETAVEALNECDPGDEPAGYAFNGDYLILGADQDVVDDAVADAEDASLADDDDFTSDMEALGDLGVATGWVDIAALIDMAPEDFVAEMGSQEAADYVKSAYQRAAATFRFDHDHVELVTAIRDDTPEIEHGPNEIVGLPDSTVAAVSWAGGSERLDATWDDLMSMVEAGGTDVEQEIADFEAETGFSIPEDLQTLLGDNLLMAIDGEGLDAGALQSGDFAGIDAGVRFTSDPDDLQALYDRIVSMAEAGVGAELPIAKADFDDGLAIATNDDYADVLASGDGDLGSSEAFQSVIEDAADQEGILYVDFDALEPVVLDGLGMAGAPAEVGDNIEPLRAFGAFGRTDGDYTLATYRLSVND